MEFVTDERNSDLDSSFTSGFDEKELQTAEERRQNFDDSDISDMDDWEISSVSSVSSADLESQYDSSSDNEDNINEDWTDAVHPIDMRPFTEDVGPTHNLPTGASPIHYFNLMFEDRFFPNDCRPDQQQNGTADTRWIATTIDEVHAFFSLQIIMGIHNLPEYSHYRAENKNLNVQGVSDVMPEARYEKLSQYLHLTDNIHQPAADSPDYHPLFKVRPLMDMLNRNFLQHYTPGRELSWWSHDRIQGAFFTKAVHAWEADEMGDQSLAAVRIDNWLHFTVPSLHRKKRSKSRQQRPPTQSCNEPSTATPETELPCPFWQLLQLSTTDGRPDQTLDLRMRNFTPEQKRITTSPEECQTQTPRGYTQATERRSTCDSVERQAASCHYINKPAAYRQHAPAQTRRSHQQAWHSDQLQQVYGRSWPSWPTQSLLFRWTWTQEVVEIYTQLLPGPSHSECTPAFPCLQPAFAKIIPQVHPPQLPTTGSRCPMWWIYFPEETSWIESQHQDSHTIAEITEHLQPSSSPGRRKKEDLPQVLHGWNKDTSKQNARDQLQVPRMQRCLVYKRKGLLWQIPHKRIWYSLVEKIILLPVVLTMCSVFSDKFYCQQFQLCADIV